MESQSDCQRNGGKGDESSFKIEVGEPSDTSPVGDETTPVKIRISQDGERSFERAKEAPDANDEVVIGTEEERWLDVDRQHDESLTSLSLVELAKSNQDSLSAPVTTEMTAKLLSDFNQAQADLVES